MGLYWGYMGGVYSMGVHGVYTGCTGCLVAKGFRAEGYEFRVSGLGLKVECSHTWGVVSLRVVEASKISFFVWTYGIHQPR